MKIAIIASGFLPVIDGVTVSGYQRLQKLSDWGHQVLLFCPDYSMLPEIYPDWQDYTGEILPNVRVVSLPSDPFMGLDFERNIGRRAQQPLMQALAAFQPDIVHVDEPERIAVGLFKIPGIRYAQQAGIPCVSFFRTNFIEYAEDYFPWPGFAIAPSKPSLRCTCATSTTPTIKPMSPARLPKLKLSNLAFIIPNMPT